MKLSQCLRCVKMLPTKGTQLGFGTEPQCLRHMEQNKKFVTHKINATQQI